MTGSLPAISSSWHQALEAHDQRFFFQLNPCGHSPYVISSLMRSGFVFYEYAWPSVKCTYCTYRMLLKILPFVLYTGPLPVQALQSRLFPFYVSYATMTV
jgi:hypothetical protein